MILPLSILHHIYAYMHCNSPPWLLIEVGFKFWQSMSNYYQPKKKNRMNFIQAFILFMSIIFASIVHASWMILKSWLRRMLNNFVKWSSFLQQSNPSARVDIVWESIVTPFLKNVWILFSWINLPFSRHVWSKWLHLAPMKYQVVLIFSVVSQM